MAVALALRLRVFVGGIPGGVDTWYYLASAEALRRRKRLPISLPQYVFHDATESYPAVFPVFLALLPPSLLRRWFWLVSPIIDACQLILLYLLSFRLTGSLLAAGIAGLVYAVTPQLISETRNLNGRAFASLLQTITMVTLLWSRIPTNGPILGWLGGHQSAAEVAAVVLVAILYNTHTSTMIAFALSTAVLSLTTGDPHFIGVTLAGFPCAFLISGGYYRKVLENHLHAARFWLRNVHLTRAHQVEDSPMIRAEGSRDSQSIYRRGLRPRLELVARVLGENPFIVAMLVAPIPVNVWGRDMYWWAVAILGWALATTFIRPLRIFGPGFHYMKASVFPSAYTLAITVNVNGRAIPKIGLALSLLASFAALAYFYRLMALRQTEHTARTPPELLEAAAFLRALPGRVCLVLPNMYADFFSYQAKKSVLWGGHSGDLRKFEEFFPVLRKPLTYFFCKYAVDYVVLDLAYTTPERLQVASLVRPLQVYGNIAIYAVLQREPLQVSSGVLVESSI